MATFYEELGFYADMYEQKMRNEERSQNTIVSYRRTYNDFTAFVKQYSKKLNFLNLKEMDIHAFLRYKRDNMNKQGDLSIASKQAFVTHLRMLFKFIEKNSDDDVIYDFNRVFEDIRLKNPKREPKGISEQDIARIFNYIEKDKLSNSYLAYRNALLFKIIYYAGLRASEVIALRYSDFRDDSDAFRIVFAGKGGKERAVFIKKELILEELSYLQSQFNKHSSDSIALTQRGNIMDRVQLFKMLNALYKHAGVRASGVHLLRHTAAKRMVAKRVNIVAVQNMLGHSSIQTTSIYTNPTEEFVKSEIMK